MIAVGSRTAGQEGYNIFHVFRIICGRIPSAYIESVKASDDAARKRVASMLKAGMIDESGLTIEDVADVERRKIQGWGGIVLSIRLRGSAEGLIAFVGPRQIMIRGDGTAVKDEFITNIAGDMHAAGYPEVGLCL
jgi:hypothetical protein